MLITRASSETEIMRDDENEESAASEGDGSSEVQLPLEEDDARRKETVTHTAKKTEERGDARPSHRPDTKHT